MPNEGEGAELVPGYDAFNRGRFDSLLELFDPDFEWHEDPEVPGRHVAHGREEFVRYLRGYGRLWDEFAFEPVRLIEHGELVLVDVRAVGRGRATGDRVELRILHLWTARGGRAVRMRAFFDEATAREAAGLPPA